MVLSRNDKRKRKEGDLVDLMDPLGEPPKRTKIHAQRKFAQGVATIPVYSPVSTPIKEKEKAKPSVFSELITHKRPNTEDFLTFLCFRGTSILPPSLNFFNATSKKNKSQEGAKSNHVTKTNNAAEKSVSSAKNEQKNSTPAAQKVAVSKEKVTNSQKKQISAPIPKNIKLKTTSTAIQALKKKYQEQRLAKQRFKKKFKPTCMKTRSCATIVEQLPEKVVTTKVEVSKKIAPKTESRRHGLRSTGLSESEKKSLPLKPLKKQIPIKLKKKPAAKDDASNVDSFVGKNGKQKIAAKVPTGKLIQSKLIHKKKAIEARRVTRSRTDVPTSPEPTRRPTRKTKEAAAVYMEILGRKLVSPELENEDNMSVDSFPELPNARKIAQTENEIKAKVKSLKNQANANADKEKAALKEKEKEKKATNGASANNSKVVKKKIEKPAAPLKNKRGVKVQKYCELNTDEESESSREILEEIKVPAVTRRSAPAGGAKIKKLENRNLRSSRSLTTKKIAAKPVMKPDEIQQITTNESAKPAKNPESSSSTKGNKESSSVKEKEITKEKPIAGTKRKRDSNACDKEKEKEKENSTKKSEAAKNKSKANDIVAEESEEESLSTLLHKSKKRPEPQEEERPNDIVVKKASEPKVDKASSLLTSITTSTSTMSTTKSTTVELLKSQETVTNKISDDEESFRGFTKKAISKVQSHAKANSGLLEDIDSKANVLANAALKDIKKMDIKVMTTTTGAFPCIKTLLEPMSSSSTNAVTNPSVKQEPDFGDLKPIKHLNVSSAAPSSLNIIDMPKSLTHGRKERVNMSTEQIEKWLNESCLAKEESKMEMESVSSFKYDSPNLEKPKPEMVSSHLSISPKIQHLVRPVNVTLSKLSDRLKKASSAISANKSVFLQGSAGHLMTPVKPQLNSPQATKPKPPPAPGDAAAAPAAPPPVAGVAAPLPVKDKKDSPSTPPSRKLSKDSSFGEDPADSDAVSKSDAMSVGDSSEKKSLSSPEKKVFFHQRKPFLPKVKERKPASSASAFSPENESSVYAFESEAEAPVNTPFRRKAKDTPVKDSPTGSAAKEKEKCTQSAGAQPASNDAKKKSPGEEATKVTEPLNSPEEARKDAGKSPPLLERTTPKNFELPKNFADLTNVQVLPLDKLTTSWSNVNYSASIAVQVNLDEQKQQKQQQSTTAEGNGESSATQKSTEISTQTDANTDNDDDNDSGQLFYIPLQAVTRNGSAQGGQQLIQGVAVKLGTEGPTGPNQRVLLKAKLVTKPPISVARCPPIGTVQPTARTPQNVNSEQVDIPSTSSIESEDANFKPPLEKPVKAATIANKQNRKTMSPEKIVKSPKSRERKSSTDNSKGAKKAQGKAKNLQIHAPVNKTTFPKTKECNEEPRLVEAPTFRPSEKDFQDPLEYIDKIRPIAEKFGICKVIPPSNFKPECKVSDDMRFTAYNHYVHRMLNRWGPNVKEMMAIKKYLATQSITLTQPPWIGGMEVDLPHLYQTVQNLGGLKEVIEKKKWQKVADGMKIPRSAQDRVTKLDDIYCKYLLPYDTLSQDERDKLFKDVEADWMKREKKDRQESQSTDTEDEDEEDFTEEIEECIVKGRNMPLNAFYRIARNTQRMWFGENQKQTSEIDETAADEVETAFWKHVVEKKRHVCVHAASIDSSGRGFGFSVAKNSPFGRHPWNLKILTNNAGSVLRALGPQMGVTVPTLHVGMLFSACCWYRDPHGLPWIEYLHTGAKKIWYGIPDEQNSAFRKALTKMFPRYCKNKTIWLPSDTAMVPPDMLVSNGVPLCQTVQEPGQFIIVFPKAFTSSICTGYVVSESVYFAQPSWLETAEQMFHDLRSSCEPSIFSFERLLFSIINDSRSHIDVLKQILPIVIKLCDKEIENRKKLKELGLANIEKLPLPETEKKGKGKKVKEEEGDYECDTCRSNLFVSLVSNPTDESIFCLTHAVQYIEKKKQVLKNCTLMYTYSEGELNNLIHKLKDRIEAKSKKTNQTKQAK